MQTKIYFDGACPLCSREIRHYQVKDSKHRCDFIDITSPAFNAVTEGLDPQRVTAVMHVRDANGKLHTGVDAFLEIWKLFPAYRWLVPIARLPCIYQLLQVGYIVFAKIRHLLPFRKKMCEGSCST